MYYWETECNWLGFLFSSPAILQFISLSHTILPLHFKATVLFHFLILNVDPHLIEVSWFYFCKLNLPLFSLKCLLWSSTCNSYFLSLYFFFISLLSCIFIRTQHSLHMQGASVVNFHVPFDPLWRKVISSAGSTVAVTILL